MLPINKYRLKVKNRLKVGVLSLLFVGISLLGWLVLGEVILVFCLGVIVGSIIITQIESYHGIEELFEKQDLQTYRQLESLFSIYSLLNINHPLPPMRGWAISPDLAKILISAIDERKPKLILEASSGVSTLIAAYTLQKIGEGTVVSLEHDEQYIEVVKDNLKKHGLQDTATIIHAPLKETVIGDSTRLWYDTAQLKDLKSIDMVIVDGPPSGTQKLARYPALPILFNSLSDDAVIILDDAFRRDEKQTLELWLKEFDCFESRVFNTEKGTIMLYKK